MRLIFSVIAYVFFSTSYAQIYYNNAWNEKRLAKLLPVKDTIKVLYFGHNITRKYVSRFETIPFPDTLAQFKHLEQLYIGHATTLISVENGGEKLTALKDVELSIQNIGAEIGITLKN